MAFGRKQLKNPTPNKFIWWVRVYTAVAVAFISWMPTTSFISHTFQDISTSLIGLTVTIANIILPFFGVETDKKEVDIDDVSSMEESKDEKKD